MTTTELQTLAATIAGEYGIDPALVCSVCAHESGGWNAWAVRYEPGFYRRYIESMTGLTDTEKTMRATSFGLMQVMGQVAREQGFNGKYLTELLDPANAITQGCKRLKKALDKEHGNVPAALLNYNGGGNANYPDLVMAHYKDYAYLNGRT